ncbi:MAG: ATP-binding protein [Azonexus sp.]|nr:ATP-binding protein [Azonexus sp.]
MGNLLGPRLIEAAKAPDQALTYYWNRPDDPDNYHYKKLSWVVYVPAYDWYLGASVYAEDLGQSGTLLGQRLMLAFLVGLLLTTVVLMAFISQLTRPILRLARLARRNAEEDWVMCPETGRGDELAELSDAFNRMVSAQQQRISELKAGEIRLRSLLDQSLVGMFVIQGERFSYVNQVFAELHGFADPAALVETVAATSLICAEDRPVVEADLRQQLAGEMGAAERIIHVRHRQGHTLEVAVSARGCEYAGAPAVIGVVVDVTARQQAERAAAQALQAAENLSRLKSEFMANMSHELRTPLHGVIGLAHVGSRARDLDSAHRYFGQILHAARLLMEMVENVLDFSLLEGRVAVVQAADFSPQVLLTELAGVWRTQAEAKGLQFELAIAATLPAQLHGDAAQARKVLNSLLSNAVKFTSSGTVQLGAAYDSGWLTVSVQDTGLGMTADEVDRLFNPFAQLDGSATRHRGGMGLGLALADRVAKLLGGEIEVSSAPGEGSRFILRLPLALT